jgi:hypothetical protein
MGKRKERPDPIADYIEWTEHRYDPGYYLGGRIPPHLRKSRLGPKGRRNAGILLLILGIVGCAGLMWSPGDTWIRVMAATWPVLMVFAGVVMLLSRDVKGDSNTFRR